MSLKYFDKGIRALSKVDNFNRALVSLRILLPQMNLWNGVSPQAI